MEENKFRKNKEINDLMEEMRRVGIRKFKEMFGAEMVEQIKDMAQAEKRLFPVKEKIRLQGILKHDYPLCEKCVNYNGVQAKSTPCPHDNAKVEKCITFEKGELSNNPFDVEVCEFFMWRKDA